MYCSHRSNVKDFVTPFLMLVLRNAYNGVYIRSEESSLEGKPESGGEKVSHFSARIFEINNIY